MATKAGTTTPTKGCLWIPGARLQCAPFVAGKRVEIDNTPSSDPKFEGKFVLVEWKEKTEVTFSRSARPFRLVITEKQYVALRDKREPPSQLLEKFSLSNHMVAKMFVPLKGGTALPFMAYRAVVDIASDGTFALSAEFSKEYAQGLAAVCFREGHVSVTAATATASEPRAGSKHPHTATAPDTTGSAPSPAKKQKTSPPPPPPPPVSASATDTKAQHAVAPIDPKIKELQGKIEEAARENQELKAEVMKLKASGGGDTMSDRMEKLLEQLSDKMKQLGSLGSVVSEIQKQPPPVPITEVLTELVDGKGQINREALAMTIKSIWKSLDDVCTTNAKIHRGLEDVRTTTSQLQRDVGALMRVSGSSADGTATAAAPNNNSSAILEAGDGWSPSAMNALQRATGRAVFPPQYPMSPFPPKAMPDPSLSKILSNQGQYGGGGWSPRYQPGLAAQMFRPLPSSVAAASSASSSASRG